MAPASRPTDVDRHVSRRIRERRIMLGITQEQMAEMIGITYQQCHKYERAINRVAVSRLFRIATALGCDVGYFYEGLGNGHDAGDGQRRYLELAQNFLAAPPHAQKAIADMARALAGGV